MNKCNLKYVDPVTGLVDDNNEPIAESILHKTLKKKYGLLNQDGDSPYYVIIRTDPEFMKIFGDWTNPTEYARLRKENETNGIFNSQGEPQLYYNHLGPYILTPTGDFYYLEGARPSLSSKEQIEGANSLTGKYIEDESGIELSAFVRNKIETRIKEIEEKSEELKSSIPLLETEEEEDLYQASQNIFASQIDKLESLINNKTVFEGFIKRINNRIEKANLKIVEFFDEDDSTDNRSDIINYAKDSNETSNRANDDVDVLRFLASIPVFEKYDEDINKQELYKKINPLFGEHMFMNPSAARGMIEDVLSDILIVKDNEDIFELYLEKLKIEAQTSERAELNYIYHFLKDLDNKVEDPEDFKTKFFSAMHKAKQLYAITQIDTADDGGLKIDIIDPALSNDKVGKITNNFIEVAISIEGRTSKQISQIQSNAIDKFAKLTPSKENYISFLKELLEKDLRLPLDSKTIPALVYGISNKEDFSSLNALINKFLSTEIILEDAVFVENPRGEITLLKKLLDASPKEAVPLKNYLMRSKGFLKTLGTYEAYYKNKTSEATVFVGQKQRWSYSFVSNLQLQIAKIKRGDFTRLNQLLGRNLMYVDHLRKHAANVAVVTNTELKRPIDPNPTLHKKITAIDSHLDHFVKMFYSKKKFFAENTKRKQGEDAEKEKKDLELRNYLIYNFSADKSSIFSLLGLPRPDIHKANLYIPGQRKLGEDFKKLLKEYVLGEINKSIEESKTVETYQNLPVDKKLPYLMENLIPGYHYVSSFEADNIEHKFDIETNTYTKKYKKGKIISETIHPGIPVEFFREANYHKLGVFTSSLNKYLEENQTKVYGEDVKRAPVIRKAFILTEDFENLMNVVYDDINTIVKKNYDELSSLTLINTIDNEGEVKNVKLFDISTNIDFQGNKDVALYSYIISSFILGYEFSNIFNGHISYYKQKNNKDQNLADFLKRGPATSSEGRYPRIDKTSTETKTYKTYSGVEKTVNAAKNTVVAVVNDISASRSKFAALISTGLGGKQIAYAHEVTDGQGFITPEHFRDIITRISGWKKEDTEMFDELNDRNHEVSLKNINWIIKKSKSFTPVKFTYFNNNVLSEEQSLTGQGEGIPVFFKYSTATLFPALTAGTEAGRILDQMKQQGVDQVIFKSGSKASNFAPTTLHNEKNGIFTSIKESFTLNPFVIDTEMLKIQTEVPTKLNTSIKLGNQIIKNILVNIDITSEEKKYNFQNKRLSGKEIYEEINDTLKNILQFQLNETLTAFGYDKETLQFNNKNIKRFLTNQMDIETEVDILNLLDTDLPLETIPNFTQRVFPVISKFIEKNAGTVYTEGGSVVQVANVGFDRITDKDKSQVFFFDNNNRELTPPIPKTYKDLTKEQKERITADPDDVIYFDEEGAMSTDPKKGKMQILKAKILIPFTGLFKDNNISYEEFIKLYKAGKIDKEIFTKAIGYRIPNQAISNIENIEIVGILPPLAGDQAIVYHEITAKAGSDFDIDKMYMMLPSVRTPGKEYVIPEENKKLLEDIERETKKAILPIHDYNVLSYLRTKTGNQILQDFLDKDTNFKEFMISRYPNIEDVDFQKPIALILKHYDELQDELVKDNNYVIEADGTMLFLTTILEDVKNSHDKRFAAIIEANKEKKRKIKAIFDKYGHKKATKIEYIPADTTTKASNKNRLIELYNSILESPATYDDLMSPLDNPIIKDTINDVLFKKAEAQEKTKATTAEEFLEEIKKTGLEQLFPVSLTKARVDVLDAKALIAIMANNMTDLGESQKVNFALEFPIGLKSTDMGRIYQMAAAEDKKNKSDYKISKILSYGMTATVDAAKDDYIVSGNFTTYSANTGVMSIRLGLSLEDLFIILTNDTIMQFSTEKINAKSKATTIMTDYNVNKLDELAATVLVKLKENDSIFDIISKDDFLKNTESKKDLILGFWHLLQETAKEFNNSVVATKSDSNGTGKNISEMVALRNKLKRAQEDTTINWDKKWFKNGLTTKNNKFDPNIGTNPNAKFLGVMANNTLFLMEELSSQLFLEGQPRVIETINMMSAQLDNPLPTDENSIKLLYNYLYPFLLYKTGHRLYSMTETYGDLNEERWLLEKFPTEVLKMRNNLDNAFLNELIISSKDKEDLIKFNNAEGYTDEDKILFKESIVDLMDNYPEFVDNLVKYSYLTTGFKSTIFSFHQFFPASYFIKNFHGKAVQRFIDKSLNDIDPSQALSLIAMNNHNNYKIVKKVKENLSLINHPEYGTVFIVRDTKTLEKLKLRNVEESSFYPFIKKSGGKVNKLYGLIGIEDGYPMYDTQDINDTRLHKSYNYNLDTKSGLKSKMVNPLKIVDLNYRSIVRKLNNDSTTVSDRLIFNQEEQEIDKIFTASGKTLREVGITQEEWDSLAPTSPSSSAFYNRIYPDKPEFNTLPGKSSTPTMTYAGIGSRETPESSLNQMTEVAKILDEKGYTLNTGITFGGKEEGADKAFSLGTENKNLFSPENHGSRKKEQTIAKEIHPAPENLTAGALKLMARNTNQVFGNNLNTPVDFVLFYAKETNNPLRPKGGTGQAVEMARRKSIPTINLADSNWKQQLDNVLTGNIEIKGFSEEQQNIIDCM